MRGAILLLWMGTAPVSSVISMVLTWLEDAVHASSHRPPESLLNAAAVLIHEQTEPHGVVMLFASTFFHQWCILLLQLEESSFGFHAHSSEMGGVCVSCLF